MWIFYKTIDEVPLREGHSRSIAFSITAECDAATVAGQMQRSCHLWTEQSGVLAWRQVWETLAAMMSNAFASHSYNSCAPLCLALLADGAQMKYIACYKVPADNGHVWTVHTTQKNGEQQRPQA